LSGILGSKGDYTLNLYGDLIDLRDQSQSGFVSTLDDCRFGLKGESNWSDDVGKWALQMSGLVERGDVDHTLSGAHYGNAAGLGAQADRR
jgi:vitamin B12 transporter